MCLSFEESSDAKSVAFYMFYYYTSAKELAKSVAIKPVATRIARGHVAVLSHHALEEADYGIQSLCHTSSFVFKRFDSGHSPGRSCDAL